MEMIKVGPAGRKCGIYDWDDKGPGALAQLFVSYNDYTVNSLQFVFCEENGKLVMSNKHGANECEKFCTVAFDYPTEFLTSITGSFRTASNGMYFLSSISFGTNKGSYGPFGTPSVDATKFNFQLGNYHSFGGFHGSTNGSYGGIGGIGVYMKPITTSMIHFKDPQAKVKKEAVQEKKV